MRGSQDDNKIEMKYISLAPEGTKLEVVREDSNGYVTGYASVFNNVDHGGDVVLPGAFTKTLKEGLKRGAIKLLDSHQFGGTDAVIGIVEEAEEDSHGLKFRARFSSVPRAQEIRTKIMEGILNALSFGYDVVKWAEDETRKGVRKLIELKLYEISVVAWGMNPKAEIATVKEQQFRMTDGGLYVPVEEEKQEQQELPEAAALIAQMKNFAIDHHTRQLLASMKQGR